MNLLRIWRRRICAAQERKRTKESMYEANGKNRRRNRNRSARKQHQLIKLLVRLLGPEGGTLPLGSEFSSKNLSSILTSSLDDEEPLSLRKARCEAGSTATSLPAARSLALEARDAKIATSTATTKISFEPIAARTSREEAETKSMRACVGLSREIV